MDTKHLNYILTIAKRKNMTKAAEELYVSQSSLSQYLSKLEQEIGTPLFFRAKGELALTPAGEMYVTAARQVILIKKQLYKDISGLHNKGHLMVGATSQFALHALSEIIPIFKSRYPEVTIEITEGNFSNISKMLLEEQIDLGILAATHIPLPLQNSSTILRDEEVLFALPMTHPYCKENAKDSIPVKDFVSVFGRDNFLLSKKSSSLRELSDSLFAKYQFQPVAVCETNSISTTQNMIRQGAGVAFIAESCMAFTDEIHYYSLEPKLYRHNLLVRRQNWALNETDKAFCKLITDYFNPNLSFDTTQGCRNP